MNKKTSTQLYKTIGPLILVMLCLLSLASCSHTLDEPDGIVADFFEVSWNGVDNAEEYLVTLKNKEYVVSDTTFSLFEYVTPGETVEITVTALGKGKYKDSKTVLVDYTAEEVTEGLKFTTDNLGRHSVYCPTEMIPENGEVVLPDTYLGETISFFGGNSFSSIGGGQAISEEEKDSSYKGDDFSAIKKIRLPSGIEAIGCGALYRSEIEELYLPTGVNYIYSSAFEGCTKLSKINIPDGVTEIENYAFYGCESLEKIDIPDSLMMIGNAAFSKTGLKELTLKDKLDSIGSFAFYDCQSLEKITFPDSMPQVNLKAFHNTPWYDSQPQGLVYISDTLYNYKGEMPENTELVIPEQIKKMANSFVFKDRVNLKSITFEGEIPMIHMEAFAGCTSLSEVTLTDGLTHISHDAFYKCTALKEITLPETVTHIYAGAFSYSGLESFTAPSSLEFLNSITGMKGSFEKCVDLKTVTLDPSSVKKIFSNTFYGCKTLESITFPDTLEIIHDLAFVDCKHITEISFPDSMKQFTFTAFAGTGITSLVLPTNLEKYYLYCMDDSAAYVKGVGIEYLIIKKDTALVDIIIMYLSPKLDTFYYEGTEEEWESVTVDTEYIPFGFTPPSRIEKINANVSAFMEKLTVYYYSETEPTEDGNFWHYVDGVPAKW